MVNYDDDEPQNTTPPTKRKPKVIFTELEQIFFKKMFDAYESQYKTKSVLNHAMCMALRKKLIRLEMMK